MIETLTVIGTAWIALTVYQKKEELVYYLVGAVVLLFLLKYYTQFRLRKRQFVSNLVEQRTMELRFQRDAMQAESEKLSRALSALADAQDELVRKETSGIDRPINERSGRPYLESLELYQ